jgi:hypothetical protein
VMVVAAAGFSKSKRTQLMRGNCTEQRRMHRRLHSAECIHQVMCSICKAYIYSLSLQNTYTPPLCSLHVANTGACNHACGTCMAAPCGAAQVCNQKSGRLSCKLNLILHRRQRARTSRHIAACTMDWPAPHSRNIRFTTHHIYTHKPNPPAARSLHLQQRQCP